jgi:hypothetical protein
MSYSFEYIDIILLAMIAGFIFLRLRGILGKKTGFEGKIPPQFEKEFQKTNIAPKPVSENFDEASQKEFLKGAKIAYEANLFWVKKFMTSLKKLLKKELTKVILLK